MKRLVALTLAILGMAVSSISLAQGVKFAVGQTWTGTFQGFGTWTVKFSEVDSDGDPRGITTGGPDERTAGGFDNNGKPAFYTVKSGDAVICYAASAVAQNGVYSGAITRQQGNATPQKLGTPCTFSQAGSLIQGASAAWPPALSVGTTVRVETRSVWTGTLTGQEQGDWVGKVTSPNGGTGKMYGYQNDDGSFEFQVVNTTGVTDQYEYCTFDKSTLVSPGVYQGDRYYAANKDAKPQSDGKCRVVIGNAVQVQVNPQPSPQPQPNPVGPALPWPSIITVGQTWRIVITGAQAVTFTLNLTGLDEFETPSGKVGAQTISMFPSRSQESTVIEIIGTPGAPIISCTFKGASSVRGSSLVGGKVQTRVNRGALPVEQPGTCEATLVTGGSASVAPAPIAPAPVAPAPVTPNPQTATPPITSAWPLKLEVGQSWRAEIQGLGSWNVTFKILDRDGYPQGSAVPNSSGATLEAAFFYFQNDNDMRLKLTSGNTLYRCIFERNEINGLTFSGWRYVDSADGKSLDKTAQRCTMTYIGRVTLSSLLDPLAGFTSSVAASHSSDR